MTEVYILDGGLGTSLEQHYGVTFSQSRPLWSGDLVVSDPDTLRQCQQDFGQIPVDILLTATYQTSFEGFSKTTSSEFPEGIPAAAVPRFVDQAVQVAQEASTPNVKIALSVGPYGACMIPSQEYSGIYDADHDSEDLLIEWHSRRFELFAGIPDLASRVRFIALETVPRKDEIIALRKAIGKTHNLQKIPFWISCLYPNDNGQLPDGTPATEVVKSMLSREYGPLPWGIGINCTKIERIRPIIAQYEAAVEQLIQEGEVPAWPALVLYPDGTNGEVYNTTSQQWEKPVAENDIHRIPWEAQLASYVQEIKSTQKWKEIVVGGCCMADFHAISKLKELLK